MKPALRNNTRSRRHQRGMSIIELMVSVVIGLFVVSAVLVNYLGSGVTGRQQGSLAQLSEDAQLAFNLLARDIQMAGYSDPTGTATVGTATVATFGRLYSGNAVFGCERVFNDAAANAGSATCATTGSTATHAIEVNYQATSRNSILSSSNVPTDCLGNELTISGSYYVASNRYYITATTATSRPELHCVSPGRSAQPLIENVESMVFWYGEADSVDPRRAVRYVKAGSVVDWGRVVSVRICLLMRSAAPVLSSDDYLSYTDCEGTTQTSADKRLYRAFYSTVTLRNKAGY